MRKGGIVLKVVVEIKEDLEETTVHILTKEYNEDIKKLEKQLNAYPQLQEIKGYLLEKECFLNLDDVLFFETEGRDIVAHTIDKVYQVKYKLYELEQLLPDFYVRVSKSAIVNVKNIYAINRDLVRNGMVEFKGSHKNVSISRTYYKNFQYVLERKRK